MVERLMGVATAPGVLRQTVSGIAGHRPILVHRGNVYDATAVALLDHLPGGQLGAEKGALEVSGEYLLVLFFCRIEFIGVRSSH